MIIYICIYAYVHIYAHTHIYTPIGQQVQEIITLLCLQDPPLPTPIESKITGSWNEKYLVLDWYEVLKPVPQAGRNQSQMWHGLKPV